MNSTARKARSRSIVILLLVLVAPSWARRHNTTTSTSTSTSTSSSTTLTANQQPVANAGPDRVGTVNVTMTLDGSGSFDPDGTIAAYWWTFGDGGSTTTTTPFAPHTYTATGWFWVTLWVRDNDGAWSAAGDQALVAIGTDTVTTTTSTSSTSRPSTTSTSHATNTSTSTSRPTTTSTSTSQPSTTTVPGGWARAIGSTSVDLGNAVATDASNSRFVGGSFHGSVAVGGTTLVSAGGADWFLAKYTSAGTLAWAKRFGGTDDDTLTALAVDPAGDVVAVGRFQGSASFGGTTFVSNGSTDIVVAKYSGSTGAHLWSHRFGDASTQSAEAVATDPSGNVLLTGYFAGSVDFGTGVLRTPYVGDYDTFVAKLTSAGATAWARGFVNTGNEFGTGIATDGFGNVALTGYFNATVDFGGGTFTALSYPDAFLAKFSAAGAHVWSKALGATDGGDTGRAVAMDASGNVLLGMQSDHAVDVGGGLLSALGGTDVVVAKYTANGAHVWSRRIGGTSTDEVSGVAFDKNGNVLIEGDFRFTANFGGVSVTSLGAEDAYVAKYTATGGLLWVEHLGGSSSDYGNAVAVTPAGEPLIAGTFNGSGIFASTSLTSAGLGDAFVARLQP